MKTENEYYDYRQPLFDLLANDHNLILLETEMDDIIHTVKELKKPHPVPLKDRLDAIANHLPIRKAVGTLVAFMKDDPDNFKCFIRLPFSIGDEVYELTLMRTKHVSTDKIIPLPTPEPK